MKSFIKKILCIAVVGLSSQLEVQALETGKPAPSFSLKTYDGEVVSLESLRGSIVVLEWFNKGCPFVVKHYKNGDMQALQKSAVEKGVRWLTINSTEAEHRDYLDRAKAAATKTEWKIDSATMLVDVSGEVGKMYGAKTTPHMFIIDAAGVLQYQGAIDDDPDFGGNPKTAKNFVKIAVDNLLSGKALEVSADTDSYGCSVKYQ